MHFLGYIAHNRTWIYCGFISVKLEVFLNVYLRIYSSLYIAVWYLLFHISVVSFACDPSQTPSVAPGALTTLSVLMHGL